MHTGNSHLKYDYTVRGLREVVKMTADISQAKAGQGRHRLMVVASVVELSKTTLKICDGSLARQAKQV